MRLWKLSHRGDEVSKDPELQRLFRDLGPPTSQPAPPDLHAKVLARVAAQRSGRSRFVPLVRFSHAWQMAVLAACLVLSLGVNFWLGSRGPGHGEGKTEPPVPALPLYRLVTAVRHDPVVENFLAARATLRAPVSIQGFTPQEGLLSFFRLGTLYADALIALQQGAREVAAHHIAALAMGLQNVHAPVVLQTYVATLQTLLDAPQGAALLTVLALFEPLWEHAYAGEPRATEAFLFRLGAWLETLLVASTTGNRMALQGQEATLVSFQQELSQAQMPEQVLAVLPALHPLLGKPALSAAEFEAIRKQVQTLQHLLGVPPLS